MHHKVDELTQTTSDEAIDLITSRLKPLRRRDRIGASLAVLFNVLENLPDIPQGMKDDLAKSLVNDEEKKAEHAEIVKKISSMVSQIWDSNGKPTHKLPTDPDEVRAHAEFATDLAVEMLGVAMHRTWRTGFPPDTVMSTVYRHAILVLMLILDERDGEVIWGDACDGMEAALAQLKAAKLAEAA